jgi:hypothetical protein
MVRPVLSYASAIWAPTAAEKRRKGQMEALEKCQTQALRKVAGAYRAVNAQVLRKELAITSLEIYYNQTLMTAEKRWKGKNWEQYTQHTIQNAHTGSTRNVGDLTTLSVRCRWAREELGKSTQSSRRVDESRSKKLIRDYGETHAQRSWEAYKKGNTNEAPAYSGDWTQANLRLYADLTKAQSSIAFQIRTEKVGLRSFLYERRVPDVDSPTCQCLGGRQTARHIVLNCPRYPKDVLRNACGTLDYRTLTNSPNGLRKIAKWFLKFDILEQFRTARTLDPSHLEY